MKSWVKAWLVAGVGCCVCGAVLTGIGVASGGGKYVKAADLNKMDGAAKKGDNEVLLEKTKLDEFDSVDISMTNMNLQVVPSDDRSCYISYQASNQTKDPMSYQVKDGKLTIRENDNTGKFYYHVDIGFLSGLLGGGQITTDENVVTLYIPEEQEWKMADIKTDMSNIMLNGCKIENGTVQSNSGDIYFKNCDFDNLKIDSDMGDIHFVGTEDVMGAWNIQIDTDMGNIDVDDALGGKVKEDEDDYDPSYTQKGKGGNLVIQTNINAFGAFAMSGVGAHSKIEGIVFLPIMSMSMALPTFVSQNIGAGEYERAKKGAAVGTISSMVLAELVGILYFIWAPYAMRIFVNAPEAIEFGVIHCRTTALFFFLLAFSHCAAGVMRGCGKSFMPMAAMLAFWCGVRILYVSIAIQIVPVFQTISWAYPLTWFLSSVAFFVSLVRMDWKKL